MRGIAERLHESRQIELAKQLLESKGYNVVKEATATYTGEPSDYSPSGRSYYSDPKNWQEKHAKTEKFVQDNMKDVKSKGRSSWKSIWELPNGDRYEIDYWEDTASLEDQLNYMKDYYDQIAPVKVLSPEEQKKQHAVELLKKAKKTNDAAIAWELIDYLHDHMLLEK